MNAHMLVGALVVFLLVSILLMLGLHAYARWKWESERTEVEVYSHEAHEQKAAARKGLDRAMVDALPTFIYKTDTIQGLTASEARLECPVCLCEFQHNEKGRLLPKCSHRFHADCIDTWLLSNASCPVCRASARPETGVSSERDDLRAGSGFNVAMIHDDRNIVGAGVRFPTNVLFWGNNSHVTSRVSRDHPPTLVIQIHTQPYLIPPASSSSSSTDQPHASSSTHIHRLHSLRRLLGREINQVQHRPTQEQAMINDSTGDGGPSLSISGIKIHNHSGEYGDLSPSISGPIKL